MRVKIKLFATLRNFGPEEQLRELPDDASIGDAISLLQLPPHIPLLKIVNGEHRPVDYRLRDGDELALFPPIAGGAASARSDSPDGQKDVGVKHQP